MLKKMKPTNLLIVDDEIEMRSVLTDTLKIIGAKIFVAQDGLEALEILKNNRISAILSDVNMPRMKGIDLLRSIRENGYLTPFVIMTAFGDKRMALDALRLGAFDFIEKPWSHDQLFDVIQKALEMGNEILFWENEVGIQKLVWDYQEENTQRLITALSRK